MKLRIARAIMRSPGWSRLPLRVQQWCIHHWMLQYASYQRFLAEQPWIPEEKTT